MKKSCLLFVLISILLHINPVFGGSVASINYPTYGTTEDNLEMSGTILSVKPWAKILHSILDQNLFEPYVLELEILVDAGDCMAQPRSFYVKKGLDVNALKVGNIVEFKINRNSCTDPDLLVIIELINHFTGK